MSNAFFHKASLCNLLFLPIRELVRVRARTFCAKTVRDCSRTADFGLFVTFRLFDSTMLKEHENCSLNAGHAGIAGSLAVGILLVSTVFRAVNARRRRASAPGRK